MAVRRYMVRRLRERWGVFRDGAREPLQTFERKTDAVSRASELAARDDVSLFVEGTATDEPPAAA